jgi:hypothetical protein
MDEESHKTYQELWEQYIEVERRELEQRRNGQLGRAIGRALPGESHEELERIAEEDRPARIESENARAAWIQERLRRQPRPH